MHATSPHVLVEAGDVTVVRFHRPEKKNAITADMYAALADALNAAAADDAVRVVIVTMDSHLASATDRAAKELRRELPGLSLTLHAASEFTSSQSELARCRTAIAEGDIIIATMLFMEEHYLPVLDARSSQILLVSNQLAAGDKSQSPFDAFLLDEAPRPLHPLDVNLHLQGVAVGHHGDRATAVDHLDLGGELQVGGGHGGGTVDQQAADLHLTTAAVDRDGLAVEQDVEHVLAHTGDGGVFVVDVGDAHGGDGAALEPTDQHPPEGGAEGGGLAPVQGPDQEDARLGAIVGNLVLDPVDLVLQHGQGRRRGEGGRGGSVAEPWSFRRDDAWACGNRCGAGESRHGSG